VELEPLIIVMLGTVVGESLELFSNLYARKGHSCCSLIVALNLKSCNIKLGMAHSHDVDALSYIIK